MKISSGRKLSAAVFVIFLSTLAFSQSVTISLPANGATVGSPVHVVATANGGTAAVTAIRLYVDNKIITTLNSSHMDISPAMAAGSHNLVIVGWNTAGLSFSSSRTIKVPAAAPAPPPPPSPFAADFHSTSNWLASQSAATGALLYSTTRINPYYANLAAIGLVKDSARYVQIENWMRWYISHLNKTDRWNLGGTMYDYNIVSGVELSSGDADSTDSYAATFLSLAYAYFATGNPAAQSYVRSISSELEQIANVLVKTQQSDGLTWAKPNYQIKYLMDNSEVFRGLADVSTLFGSMGDTAKRTYYSALATNCQRGIWGMWMGTKWAVYKDALGRLIAPTMSTWYPDATAQMFPVLYGAVPGTDSKAQTAYATFLKAWPGWAQLSFNAQDPFPWVMVAGGAALVGDKTRVNTYASSVRTKWVNKGFPWTWYSMEAGWYLRLATYMQGGSAL